MKGVVIIDNPNFCEYVPRYDLIIISSCYQEDQKLFSWLLEHEMGHRRIQTQHWYLGAFNHVWHDWKFRFKLMFGEGHEFYTKYLNLSEGGDNTRIKDLFSSIVYFILTMPTVIFKVISKFRILRRGGEK